MSCSYPAAKQKSIAEEYSFSCKSRFNQLFCWGLLVTFSTAFSFAMGEDQRNFLVIGMMGVASTLYLLTAFQFQKQEVYGWLLLLSILLFWWTEPESFRLNSFLYSAMFITTFLYYMRMLYSGFLNKEHYLIILKGIIYAYTWILLVQQFCVVMHWPVFNFILGEPEAFKLNSLSPEPSHSARILVIVMYAYVWMREIGLQHRYHLFQDGIADKNLWLCFFYTMLTMGSGTAYFLLPLFLLRFISSWVVLWGTVIAGLCIWLKLPELLDISAWNRVHLFSQAVLTGDPMKMLLTDHSASIRVLPSYYYSMFAVPSIPEFWLGYGMAFNIEIFPELIPGVPQGVSLGGIFPSFLLNHGVIAGIFLLLMISKFCLSHLFSFSTLLTIILIFSCGFNTQIPWLIFLLLGTNKYFTGQVRITMKSQTGEEDVLPHIPAQA